MKEGGWVNTYAQSKERTFGLNEIAANKRMNEWMMASAQQNQTMNPICAALSLSLSLELLHQVYVKWFACNNCSLSSQEALP